MVARAVDKRAILILSILLGIALALRCAGISRESFWIDEFFTWGFASKVRFFDRRYMSPASPFVYAAIAAAGWAAAGMYVSLLLIPLYYYYFVPRYGKEQWREAISYIEAPASPNWQVTLGAGREMARSPSMMESRLHGFHRVWLVRSHSENDDALSALRAASRQQSYRVFPKANIIEVYSFSVGGAY